MVDSDWNQQSIDVALMSGIEEHFRKTREGKCHVYVPYDEQSPSAKGKNRTSDFAMTSHSRAHSNPSQ